MTAIDDARDRAAQARHELGGALDAIEDKLNLPKRIAGAYRRNPVPVVLGGVAAAAAVVGLIALAAVRARD